MNGIMEAGLFNPDLRGALLINQLIILYCARFEEQKKEKTSGILSF